MSFKGERICRVCGSFYSGYLRDESGSPSYVICQTCGTEAGYEDETYDDAKFIREYLIQNYEKGNKIHFFSLNNLENLKFKEINEILLEVIQFMFSNSVQEAYFRFFNNGVIQSRIIISAIVYYLKHEQFENISKELISELLHEIEKTDFPIPEDQRSILENYASPTPGATPGM